MLPSSRFLVFIFVIIALILCGLASSNTAEDIWYQELVKSSLNPPGYVFGIVWPILYLLMSIAAFRTFKETKNLFLYAVCKMSFMSFLTRGSPPVKLIL